MYTRKLTIVTAFLFCCVLMFAGWTGLQIMMFDGRPQTMTLVERTTQPTTTHLVQTDQPTPDEELAAHSRYLRGELDKIKMHTILNSGVTLSIGIPTIARVGSDGKPLEYVKQTLLGLQKNFERYPWLKKIVRVVVYNANFPPEKNALTTSWVRETFKDLMTEGRLEILEKYEPFAEIDFLTPDQDPNPWAQKLSLDMALIMNHVEKHNTSFYLHLEDDALPATNAILDTLWWVVTYWTPRCSDTPKESARKTSWLFLTMWRNGGPHTDQSDVRCDGTGTVSLLFKHSDLKMIAESFHEEFKQRPADWILGDIESRTGNHCYTRIPSPFQHIGKRSSGGRERPHSAKEYAGDLPYWYAKADG